MKSIWPLLAAIFFMTYFYRTRGSMAPSAPLDPLLTYIQIRSIPVKWMVKIKQTSILAFHYPAPDIMIWFAYICKCNGEIYVLPEQEVLSTIQPLRTCTAQEMTAEMGPWAAEYTVKMEDIQTNFRLTNENGRSCHKPVTSNYTELFAWPGGYQ